jgi:hypothetical protein
MNNAQSGVGYRRPPVRPRFRPGRSGNPAGRPIRRLSIRAVLPAKRPKTTPGNDRDGALGKLRVCVTSAVDTMTAPAVDTMTAAAVDTMTAAAIDITTTVAVDITTAVAVDITTTAVVDTMTAVAVDATTTAAIDTTTTAVIDTTIASGGRNSLPTTDAFDAEPY